MLEDPVLFSHMIVSASTLIVLCSLAKTLLSLRHDDKWLEVECQELQCRETTPLERTRAMRLKEHMQPILSTISSRGIAYIYEEYFVYGLFIAMLALLIFLSLVASHRDVLHGHNSAICFLVGSLVTLASLLIVYQNSILTTSKAIQCAWKANGTGAFISSLKTGLSNSAVSMIMNMIALYVCLILFSSTNYYKANTKGLALALATYALGSCVIGLYGRVSSGIFASASDVGVNLISMHFYGRQKRDMRLDKRNTSVMCSLIGNYLNTVTGLVSDLSSSMMLGIVAYLTTITLVLAGDNDFDPLILFYYPFVLLFIAIALNNLTGHFLEHRMDMDTTNSMEANEANDSVRNLIIMNGVLLCPISAILAYALLPSEMRIIDILGYHQSITPLSISLCIGCGVMVSLSGALLSFTAQSTCQKLAKAVEQGVASLLMEGSQLGHNFTFAFGLLLSLALYVSTRTLGVYGIACLLLGMITLVPTGVTIGSSSAVVIALFEISYLTNMHISMKRQARALRMASFSADSLVRGMSFVLSYVACLCLGTIFFTKLMNEVTDATSMMSFVTMTFVILGSTLPHLFCSYGFAAITTVAAALLREAEKCYDENRELLKAVLVTVDTSENFIENVYGNSIKIAAKASLQEMLTPSFLALVVPLSIGIFFGLLPVFCLLIGSLLAEISLSVHMMVSGGSFEGVSMIVNDISLTYPSVSSYRRSTKKVKEEKHDLMDKFKESRQADAKAKSMGNWTSDSDSEEIETGHGVTSSFVNQAIAFECDNKDGSSISSTSPFRQTRAIRELDDAEEARESSAGESDGSGGESDIYTRNLLSDDARFTSLICDTYGKPLREHLAPSIQAYSKFQFVMTLIVYQIFLSVNHGQGLLSYL